MRRPLLAGLIYVALVFSIGVMLGALRVQLLVPQIGELGAVLVELPFILIASWKVSEIVVRRCLRPADHAGALMMGGIAFAGLMVAEFGLARVGFDRSVSAQIALWATPAGALGLAGQILFALFPWIQASRPSSI